MDSARVSDGRLDLQGSAESILHSGSIALAGASPRMSGRWPVALLVLLLAFAALFGVPGPAAAALEKPAYTAGNRWVYDLQGSLDTFPGLNASEVGSFRFGLVGRVDVRVIGPDTANVAGAAIPAVRVETRASGYLNGTFSAPPGGPPGAVTVTGSFSTTTTELWETQAYLPVVSNSTSTYVATISFFFTTELSASVRLSATTEYGSIPPFSLDVGDTATVPFTTDLLANSTITVLGQTSSSENRTTFSSTWTREVLRATDVTVDAGTFPSYELNQTLGNFPGLAGIAPVGGANETAYFSNSVGYYVDRVAVVNGTPLAEMRLLSYTYPGSASGLSLVEWSLIAGIPVLAAVAGIWLLRGRRKAKAARSPGGEPRAR